VCKGSKRTLVDLIMRSVCSDLVYRDGDRNNEKRTAANTRKAEVQAKENPKSLRENLRGLIFGATEWKVDNLHKLMKMYIPQKKFSSKKEDQ